jgi:hypothetical protein
MSPGSMGVDTRPVEPIGIDYSEKGQSQEEVLTEDLDSRRVPPRDLRDAFKRYSRATVSPKDLAQVSDSACLGEPDWSLQKDISEDLMQRLFQDFQDGELTPPSDEFRDRMHSASIYQSNIIPGRVVHLSVQHAMFAQHSIYSRVMRFSHRLVL